MGQFPNDSPVKAQGIRSRLTVRRQVAEAGLDQVKEMLSGAPWSSLASHFSGGLGPEGSVWRAFPLALSAWLALPCVLGAASAPPHSHPRSVEMSPAWRRNRPV